MVSHKKRILIVIAVALLILGGGCEKEKDEKDEDTHLDYICPLETFICNLTDEGGKRYLRVTMSLELENEALSLEFEKRLTQVRDEIISILTTQSFEDVHSKDGKSQLKEKIAKMEKRTR